MRFDETNFNVRLHAYDDELFYIRTNYDYNVEMYKLTTIMAGMLIYFI